MSNPPAPNSNRRALIILAVGLSLGLVGGLVIFAGLPQNWFGQTGTQPPGGTPGTPAPAPVTGAPAPDFTLNDLSGQPITLSGLKGQVVLINFWATWCVPCRLEMPAIQRQYEALHGRGLTVLAVNLDEPLSDVKSFVDTLDLTFAVLLDPGAVVSDLYRVRGYPTSFFIDRAGVVAREQVGVMTDAQLSTFLAKLDLKD